MNPADLEISLMRTNNTESNLKNTEKIATSINEMMDMISDDNYIPMLQNNVAKHQKRKVEICSLDDNVVYTSRKLTKELLKCSKTEKPDYEPSSAKTPQGNFFKGDSSAKIDLFKGSHKFIKDERAETCPDKTEITPEEVIGSTQNLHENKAIKDVKVPINANNLKQKNVKEIPTTVDVGQLPILDYNYSNSSRTMNENLFSPKKVFGKNEYQYGPSMGKLIERMGTGTPKKVVSEYSSSPIAAIFSPKKDSHEFADSNKLQKTTKPSICMKFGNCGRLPDLEPNKKNWLRQNMAQFAGHHASVIDSTKSFTKLKEIYNLPRTTGHSN
ncbi:Chromosome 1 open reading frame 141 [Caenorhabditis elegans]|nr:Chromosome 1 open reading frame 141 [Caenorhabditis elegans]VAY52620.1 Chromosome 1 open reading frame 141 [Caenorhabditis elegans]|eukprot:NP_001355484.1 Uncharacterized protein CELE_F23D12.10 [Caenorhabditis elegans]